MVSDKRMHKALRIQKLYKQNPLENFLIVVIYLNYTLSGRKCNLNGRMGGLDKMSPKWESWSLCNSYTLITSWVW